MASATVELVPPRAVARVAGSTAVAALTALSIAATSAASASSVAGLVRMQSTFAVLRAARVCAVATADAATSGASSSSGGDASDDVGSALFDNPLQLSLPTTDGSMRYAAGSILGNTVLCVFAVFVANLSPKRLFAAVHSGTSAGASMLLARMRVEARTVAAVAPGSGVVAMLLLLVPTVVSGVTLLLADLVAAVFGAASVLVYAVGPPMFVLVAIATFPLKSVARRQLALKQRASGRLQWRWVFEEQWQWVVDRSRPLLLFDANAFHRRFSELFGGYRGSCHWYLAADVVIPIATAVVSAVPDASSCSWTLYLLLALSVVSCLGAVCVQPCMTRWDNAWSIVSNVLSVAAAALVVADNLDAANDATAALAWISIVPVVVQLVRQVLSMLPGWNAAISDDPHVEVTTPFPPSLPKKSNRHRSSVGNIVSLNVLVNDNGHVLYDESRERALQNVIELICSRRETPRPLEKFQRQTQP